MAKGYIFDRLLNRKIEGETDLATKEELDTVEGEIPTTAEINSLIASAIAGKANILSYGDDYDAISSQFLDRLSLGDLINFDDGYIGIVVNYYNAGAGDKRCTIWVLNNEEDNNIIKVTYKDDGGGWSYGVGRIIQLSTLMSIPDEEGHVLCTDGSGGANWQKSAFTVIGDFIDSTNQSTYAINVVTNIEPTSNESLYHYLNRINPKLFCTVNGALSTTSLNAVASSESDFDSAEVVVYDNFTGAVIREFEI